MNKYFVKHKRQTLEDFQMDCHRFTFWYSGRHHSVACFHSANLRFVDETIPEFVKLAVQDVIYRMIDNNGHKWAVPKAVQAIADRYCAASFC